MADWMHRLFANTVLVVIFAVVIVVLAFAAPFLTVWAVSRLVVILLLDLHTAVRHRRFQRTGQL